MEQMKGASLRYALLSNIGLGLGWKGYPGKKL